ncbi:transporter substrate-binding domain-containing protein [Desulfolutivibrio sulfoxidireducens]|uniref:transporter substrate-binding domain-containing protein n=1 Tax=Desulfolutivibrio sulfoxidireducens TaxID=2773299 RepID=UPI00159D5727|nr:transporter substrate-binding domain-containing protein [Desulfolutivibrio sulfoxidireducens]QLA17040.1 transporter substrate-binding domain-containing protein [Desulfolutivibrio sulfoxidireducens]
MLNPAMFRRWLLAPLLAMALSPAVSPVIPASAREKTLTVLVFHRPPYYIVENGRPVGGLLVDITRKALVAANIPHVFVEAPPKRILKTLADDQEYACSVGWFKTTERERFARFSDPIYTGQPMGAAMRPDLAKTLPHDPAIADLAHKNLRLGLRAGFSYGEWLDAKLAGHRGTTDLSVTENHQLLEMIARNRIDYTVIDPEEYAWLVSQSQDIRKHTTFVALRDIPPETPRHLMCGQAVPPEVIARLNAALARPPTEPGPERTKIPPPAP